MSGRGREREVDGYLTWVNDRAELVAQNHIEVVIGRRTDRGLLVLRVEPTAVESRPVAVSPEPFVAEERHVTWAMAQRVVMPSEFGGTELFPPIERDPVSYRVPRDQARALGLALIEWADGPDVQAPSESERMVALLTESLGVERSRVERLLDAVLPPQPLAAEFRAPE